MKYLALLLCVVISPFYTSAQCDHPDYAALMSIYDALDGKNWVYNGGWTEGAAGTNCSVCDWDYVSCNSDSRVISFSAFSNGYKGTIPKEIGNLEFLEFINLSYGNITGELPEELFQLSSLKSLRLSDVGLEGSMPSAIGNLTNLEQLYMDNNRLTGEIPESIGNCTKLKTLFLTSNRLSGPIPESINKLSDIEWLELTFNKLTGPLPDVYSEGLMKIEEFDVSDNKITGSIPGSYGSFNNLRYLGLSDNMLSGCIPNSLLNLCSFMVNVSSNADLEGSGEFSEFCSDGSGSCWPLSVDENVSALKINTIVKDHLIIEGNTIDELSVDIYNLTGRRVYRTTLRSGNSVDLTALNSGFYLLTLGSDRAFVKTYKVFKQ